MRDGIAVVLVVEDNALLLIDAMELVAEQGYEALQAWDADEAIRILISRSDIDLVFTDVQMPGKMDGIKLAHYIRDRWPPVKLLIVSGLPVLDQWGLPEGSQFVAKPYCEDLVISTMARLLLNPDNSAVAVISEPA